MPMDPELRIEEVLLPEERAEAAAFLETLDLELEPRLDRTLVIRREGRIVASGSVADGVIRCVGVAPEMRHRNLTGRIVTELLRDLHQRGVTRAFVFTRPDAAPLFRALGFRELGRAPGEAVLLEHGSPDLQDHLHELGRLKPPPEVQPVGSVVVNCNPFTLGHRALLEYAAADCPRVFVFVVQEDRSSFPFSVRLRLVREGSADLPGVTVLPGGPYVISGATFPNYFLKSAEPERLRIQTRLDLDLFARHIAPALGITRRYVGQEPLCPVTRAYNRSMQEVFGRSGLRLHVMERTQDGDQVISASRVRRALVEEDWETVQRMVPASTLAYLRSAQAEPILTALRSRPENRH